MGGKTSTSTSNVSIPPEVLARYNAINTRAETAANKPFQAFGNNAADYVAQMNAQQAAGTNTINANTGPASAGIDPYITSYTKNVADTTGAYLKQQQEQAQSGALGTAVQSGAFGGDRAGVAAANLQQQNQMAYGKTMADIMNQGYTQALGASQADLNRGLQAGQMQLAAGTMGQQTEQAGKDAMINRFMQEQGLPYQQAQFLANIALGTGVASGSTTTSTQPIGFFQNLATGGKVDGYAEGGGVAGPVSHSKEAIGGLGYVPEPNLPIGDLMIAQPPNQSQDSGGDIVSQVLSMIAGKKAEGGSVVRPELPRKMGRLIPEPFEPVNFMDSREAKTIAAIPRALLESLNMLSADGHAARAEKPIDRETIRRETYGGEKMNEFYGQVEDMKQTLDRDVLGPIASGYNSIGSGISSRLADLFGTLGDDMVQKTYQDLARESADKALRYSNEGIFPRKAATPKEIEDRKELAHLTRYASGGVAGGRHGYATDGYIGPNSREEALARYNILQGGDRSENLPRGDRTENLANDFLIASGIQPLNDNYMPPQGGVAPARPMPARPISLTPQSATTPDRPMPARPISLTPPQGGVAPAFEMPDRPISLTPRSGLAPTESPRPLPRPAGLAGGADIAAAEVGATGVAPPATTRQIAKVLGGGKGFTDVEYSDGTRDRITGNLNIRNNNPGNIEFGSLAQKYGAVGTDGRFAVFPDYETGRKAQESLLFESGVYSGKTIGSAIAKYAPVGDGSNDPIAYANSVAAALGVPVDTPLSALTPEQRSAMISAMEKVEGGGGPSTYSTTPLGSNGSPIPLQIGAPMGGVKPYEDRNAVGKFFNNPEGGLNQNALLSLLSGLGTMASSRSRSPFTAILQGLGGGAETYKDLLKQSAEVTGKNIENLKALQLNYQDAVYNGLTTDTWPEYAAKNGIDITGTGSINVIGKNPIGNVDRITIEDTRSNVVRDGVEIPFMNDYESLQRLVNENIGAVPETAMGRLVAQANAKLAQIRVDGSTLDADGNKVEVPAAIQAANQVAATAMRQQQFSDFTDSGNNAVANINSMENTIGNMERILTDYKSGPLAGAGSAIGALLQFAGANMDAMPDFFQNPEKYTIAAKDAALLQAKELNALPGNAPAASIQFTEKFTPTPDMPPAAVRELLINIKAGNEYQRQYYDGFPEWAAKNPNQETDIQAYNKWFSEGRDERYKKISEEIEANTPHFLGDIPPGVNRTYFLGKSLADQQVIWGMHKRGELRNPNAVATPSGGERR